MEFLNVSTWLLLVASKQRNPIASKSSPHSCKSLDVTQQVHLERLASGRRSVAASQSPGRAARASPETLQAQTQRALSRLALQANSQKGRAKDGKSFGTIHPPSAKCQGRELLLPLLPAPWSRWQSPCHGAEWWAHSPSLTRNTGGHQFPSPQSLQNKLSVTFLVTQTVKNLPPKQEAWVWSLGQEDPLEKRMAAHSSICAWRIPWTEEPGELQFLGSHKVGHTKWLVPQQCESALCFPP